MLDTLAWGKIPSRRAREIFAHVLGLDVRLPATFVVEASIARLPFYRHWQLFRFSSRYRDGTGETELEDVWALWRPDRAPMLLDGSSEPVHAANTDEDLALDDKDIPDYIRFFCFAVRSDEGHPFVVFESAPKRVSAKNRAAAKEAKPLTPMGRGPDGSALFEATMIFAGVSFRSIYSVPPNGMIEMIDDDPLTADFPNELTPVYPPLGLGTTLRMHLAIGLGSVPTPPAITTGPARTRQRASRKRAHPPSSRSTIVEMVELLLDRALVNQTQSRLLGYFNASLPAANAIERFAALLTSSSPVVIVESTIPFVEETIAEIINDRLPSGAQLPVIRGDVGLDGNGQEVLTGFSLPSSGPAMVLVPLLVYGRAMQVERLSFDIAANDLSAFITCERSSDLPERLRRYSDLVLRLPLLDADLFEMLFKRVIGQPPPANWRTRGTEWVKHLQHTDFEHPRRMHLSRKQAFDFVHLQVEDRLGAVDPAKARRLDKLKGLGEARQFAEDLIADIHAAIDGRLDWSQVDRGALLVGAPGTGKTTLAKAIARACGIKFIQASASGWMAEGVSLGPHIQAIRRTFSEARAYAPSILFIDEIDSLGSRENLTGDHNSIYMTEIINAVLEQMQGLDPKAPVFVIGATNHEDNIDPALKRSGRLDRVIRIPRPNAEALALIYKDYIDELAGAVAIDPALDTRALGGMSVGLTGADVERIVRGAARRARIRGSALGQVDVIAEITNKPRGSSAGLRLTPAELERTAIHEAGHALASFLGPSHGSDIGFATVVPRDDGTLGFVATMPDERMYLTRGDHEDKLDVFLAGRAAEELKYGPEGVSGGASSDLRSATDLALYMVTQLALGRSGRLLISDTLSPADRKVAEQVLEESYRRILGKLQANSSQLMALADALVDRQELPGDEVRSILSVPTMVTDIPAILIKLAGWTPDNDTELPRVGYGYRPGMSDAELYDSCRAWWVVNPKRAVDYQYAVAIHDGVTLAVFEIDSGSWREWNAPTMGRSGVRWAFEGRAASPDVRDAFVGREGRRVPRRRPNGKPLFGAGNPIAYWPK